jgi:hypothetical protein
MLSNLFEFLSFRPHRLMEIWFHQYLESSSVFRPFDNSIHCLLYSDCGYSLVLMCGVYHPVVCVADYFDGFFYTVGVSCQSTALCTTPYSIRPSSERVLPTATLSVRPFIKSMMNCNIFPSIFHVFGFFYNSVPPAHVVSLQNTEWYHRGGLFSTEGLCYIGFQGGKNVYGEAVFLEPYCWLGNRFISSVICTSLLFIIRSSTLHRQLVKEISL